VQIGEKIASVPQILAKAQSCLQSAEGVGGNRIEIFDPASRDRAEEERIAAWVQRIQEALKEDQFVLNFQPMISLTGDPTENYEVLLRMKAPTGEIVSPDQFMPIAEEHGLLAELDRWVIGRTISLLAERRKAGKETTLYVKVSPSSLAEGDLHNFIGSQLKAHSVPGPAPGAAAARIEDLQLPAPAAGLPEDRRQLRLPAGAGAVRHQPELLPDAHALRPAGAEDRPQLHRRPGQERREPGQGQGIRRRRAPARQDHHRRVRFRCQQHDRAVLDRRRSRAGQLPCPADGSR
jgi:hypothetical protein